MEPRVQSLCRKEELEAALETARKGAEELARMEEERECIKADMVAREAELIKMRGESATLRGRLEKVLEEREAREAREQVREESRSGIPD